MADRFLDEHAYNWAVFDPALGYTLKSSTMRDGVDGSYTLTHYGPGGERHMVNYARRPCRINIYGDSFTQPRLHGGDVAGWYSMGVRRPTPTRIARPACELRALR